MSYSVALLGLILLALFCASPFSAQEVTGRLDGRVLDEDDVPIDGAVITVRGSGLQGVRSATSDARGFFRVPSLPPGPYVVQIRHDSYRELVLENVRIRLGQTTGLETIRLEARGVVRERVVVTAEAPRIDPRSTATGGNLTSEYYGNLPIDRDYRSVAELLPHVSASYLGDETNYAGGTGLDNRYFIDGIDTTDPFRGTTGTTLPYNFVDEVEVKLGGYEPEYRSSLGGAVNVVTHAGSNEFKANVWGYFLNDTLSGDMSQSTLQLQTGDFSKYDVGFDFSGPLIRDKLWYYVAYNPTFANADVQIPGLDYNADETTVHSFAGKLTWQISPRHNLTTTVVGDPTSRDGIGDHLFFVGVPIALENPDPYLREIETGGYNLAVQGRHILSNNLILESFFSGTTRTDNNQPATARGRAEPLFIDWETGIWADGSPSSIDADSTQLTLGLKAIRLIGDHEVRAGVEYRDNELDIDWSWQTVERFDDQFWQLWGTVNTRGTVSNRVSTVFAQDSWRISPRWHFNYGLRWDGQESVGTDGQVALSIDDQFQPRLGFVYLPGQHGSQRLYGSAGRYYHDLSTTAPWFLYSPGSGFAIQNCDQDPRIDASGCEPFLVPSDETAPKETGLHGQHYDEYSLGYQRALGSRYTVGARVVYRTLREALEDGFSDQAGDFVFGNPGRGELDNFPSVEREYRALELTFARQAADRFGFLTSYVLSDNEGNYAGLFYSDFNVPFPNISGALQIPEMLVGGDGDLPNDRTHVFKLSGFHRWDFGLTASTNLVWQSGTPLSEFGGTTWGPPFFGFVRKRGTAGRTPSIFDLNLRLLYELKLGASSKSHARLILDVFHLFSDNEPVNYDQLHYFNLDDEGSQINPSPTYGMVTRYHPPTSFRVGLEFGF